MEQLYLIDCIYEWNNERIITYFSKDPYTRKYDFIFKEKFHPYFYTDLPKEIVTSLLSDFKRKVKILTEKDKLKIIGKNKEIIDKCYKIISLSTSKKLLLIEPEREYLNQKNWSYYDLFLIISNKKIKKIENNNLGSIVKKYINPFLKEEQVKLIEKLTSKILVHNLLKINPKNNITNSEILNILFENEFFKHKIIPNKNQEIEYIKNIEKFKNFISIDFSNIWPYLLTNNFYNIGFETINCSCCKPKKYTDINILSNSLIEVSFKQDGFYFISKDKEWAKKYHNENDLKENRLNYKQQNRLQTIPVGPFFKSDIAKIPLLDAHELLNHTYIEINPNNHSFNWYCLRKESFISKIIKELLEKQKNIEKSINLSNRITYNSSFKNNLEKNPLFIQYFTEYKLINDLIEEIPKFLENKNTKFYNPIIANTIKYIKYEMINKIDIKDEKYIIEKERVIFKDKENINKINNFFPKINLPVPKLILN
jgi:hypothetical protein